MDEFPLTLEQVVKRLHCGRSWLLLHLKKHPHYRRAGRRLVFFEDDYRALIDSLPKGELEQPRAMPRGRATPAPPSPDKIYERVMAKLRAPGPKRAGPRNRQRPPKG